MDGCTWIAPVAQAVQPTTDADGAAKTAIFAIVSHIRGFPGLVLRDARSTNRISVLQSTLGGAEGVGALVRVRTLPTEWRTPISKLSALQGPHQQIAEVIDRLTCLPAAGSRRSLTSRGTRHRRHASVSLAEYSARTAAPLLIGHRALPRVGDWLRHRSEQAPLPHPCLGEQVT